MPGRRLAHGEALERARRDTAAARDRLERVYGRVPACVIVYQRAAGESPSVTHGLRIVGRVADLYRGDHRPVTVLAALPGGASLARWVRARALQDALDFARLHAEHYSDHQEMRAATVHALRTLDPLLADVERLYANGTTVTAIAELAGVDRERMRETVERMRALGFDLPHRNTYARRRVANAG